MKHSKKASKMDFVAVEKTEAIKQKAPGKQKLLELNQIDKKGC